MSYFSVGEGRALMTFGIPIFVCGDRRLLSHLINNVVHHWDCGGIILVLVWLPLMVCCDVEDIKIE
jgi:hypothetical protein